MSEQSMETFPLPNAAARARRRSLLGLGCVALVVTTVGSSTANAGKASKKAKKTCNKQVAKCQTSVTTFCSQPNLAVDQDACEAAIRPCCSSFKKCKAGAAYDCIGDAILSLAPPTSPS